MSEYHSVVIEMTNQEAIIEALQEMGYNPQIHVIPVKLQGYMGDYRNQKAHIVIPKSQISSASNDIGFEKMENGSYKIHISEYDETIAKNEDRGFQVDKIKQLYAKHRLLKKVDQKLKYKLKQQSVDSDGRIRIRLQRR